MSAQTEHRGNHALSEVVRGRRGRIIIRYNAHISPIHSRENFVDAKRRTFVTSPVVDSILNLQPSTGND